MNIKLKILVIENKTTHLQYSSDYKLSTGKQLQGLGTRTSYKLCREIVIVGKQETLSKKGSQPKTLSRKEDLN